MRRFQWYITLGDMFRFSGESGILSKEVRLVEICIIQNFTKNLISIFALNDAAKRDDCNGVSLIGIRFDFLVDPEFCPK